MKNILKYSLISFISILILNSCAASEDQMNNLSSDQTCTPVNKFLDRGQPGSINKLVIGSVDSNGAPVNEGIITWLSDKVSTTAQASTLKLYYKIALNLDFRFAVAMMMILAIMLFAMSVLLGLIQANGYNAIIFLLKLIIVYQLTINYYYFNLYVIQFFEAIVTDTIMFSSLTFSDYAAPDVNSLCLGVIGGACNLGAMIGSIFGIPDFGAFLNTMSGGATGTAASAIGKVTLFDSLDTTISELFDFRFWKMILALIGAGNAMAFFSGGLMLVFIITYLGAIVTAVKTYLMALIARYVLYGLGPLFISFALFSHTKSLFDGWLQQLINFTLQPVFLFIFLGMFQSILNGFMDQMYVNLSSGATYNIVSYDCYFQGQLDNNSSLSNPSTCTGDQTCVAGSAGCQYINTTTGLPCYVSANPQGSSCDWKVNSRTITGVTSGDMSICYHEKFSDTGQSPLNWYQLCYNTGTKVSCGNQSSIKPVLPFDIFMVISSIVICYLMGSMCHWVTNIAKSLSGGMVTLSDTPIAGWDKFKNDFGQATGGVSGMIGKLTQGGGQARK